MSAASLPILFFVPIFIFPFLLLITLFRFPILVSLVFPFSILFLNSACQQGWIGHGTSCYKLFTSPKLTWKEAQEECKEIGANLVKIESSLEEKYLRETGHLTVNHYWIGLSYSVDDQAWKWADGTKLDGYENWFGGNQQNFNHWSPCTILRSNSYYSRWGLRSCSNTNGYICEKP